MNLLVKIRHELVKKMVYGQERCQYVRVTRDLCFFLFEIVHLVFFDFQEKTCATPPIVPYSEIIQPDRTTNDTIQYICQDGYQLQGSAILKCISSQWQPIAPRCERESNIFSFRLSIKSI